MNVIKDIEGYINFTGRIFVDNFERTFARTFSQLSLKSFKS